jgi:YggT family protein
MTNALWMIIDAVGSLLGSLCLLRAYAGWVRLNPRDQFYQFSMALTDWLVKPLRKVIPGSKGIDWASVVAAFIIAALVGLAGVGIMGLASGSFGGASPMWVLMFTVFRVVRWALYLLMFLVFAQVVLSWVNPQAPVAPAINLLTEKFLSPIRRIIPSVANFDLSPLVLILILQVLLKLLPA